MPEHRRISLAFGVLYLITFITSIRRSSSFNRFSMTPPETSPVTTRNPDIPGTAPGADPDPGQHRDAPVLIPILKRQNEILPTDMSPLGSSSASSSRQASSSSLGSCRWGARRSDNASLAVSLAAVKDWTFLLRPGFMVGWGNGLILGYLMYRSRLVPRGMAMLGLIGGPLIILTFIGTCSMLGTQAARWRRSR
jgi:Domain of unknown function (DUF4386)